METSTYDPHAIRTCARCGTPYDYRRSGAELRLTFCCLTHQIAHDGATIAAILAAARPEQIRV
jgi:hypothetical protein